MSRILTILILLTIILSSCTKKLVKEFPKNSVVYVKMDDGSIEKFYVYGHSLFWVEVTSSTTDLENAVVGTVSPKSLIKETASMVQMDREATPSEITQ